MSRPHEDRHDVAVLGGGAIGLAIAWRARQRGLSVVLVDKGDLGRGASHVAAGMLAPVAEADPGERALLELGLRLELVGLGSENGFACPLNQYLLADALGLTAIHVNRVLRQLRERGLVTFREGRVEFHDLAGLRTLAEYHSGYLDQSNGLGL